MTEISELERQKLDLESQKLRVWRAVSEKKRRKEKAMKEMGELAYLEMRIRQLDEEIEGRKSAEQGVPENPV
ncbi:MAG: hypothetical protein BWY26_00153 [Elusimicrobia bacterium ADurb.Bin231]|nr:MAG: hypothetical protein BWY26_00153 [Elusimicrobia bacterium ADurb.Bin231]